MELEHPAVSLTDALVDALGHRLPDIEYQFQTPMERQEGKPIQTRTRRPDMQDIEVRMFPETWGSTALGFGGMGGAAMTAAYTVVVSSGNISLVYWAGRFAYTVEKNSTFLGYLNQGRTLSRSKASELYKTVSLVPGTEKR
jgi:predicted phage tail protein